MRLRYTDRARRDLLDVFDHINADNPDAAKTVIARIRASAEALALFPYMGRIGLVPGTLELTVAQLPFVIVYRIELGDTDRVIVLGIYHARQHRQQ